MRFPKLHLICADDFLRPAMTHAKVDKDYTFVSDAHILVRHKTSEIFTDDFVQSLPESGIMIPRKALAIIVKRATIKVSLIDDKKCIQLHRLDESVITYKCPSDLNYPDANKIIPDPKDCKPLSKIGLNSNLLDKLSDGLGCDIPILHLTFFSESKVICCTAPHTDYESAIGIIMPVNLNL